MASFFEPAFSVFGIIPFHASPFLLILLANDLAMSLPVVGTFPASIMTGQLAAALILGNVSTSFSLTWVARLSFCGEHRSTFMATFAQVDVTKLLILGFLLRISSGVLMFFGTCVSITADDKPKAFATRLGYSLINTGIVISLLTVLFGSLNLAGLFLILAVIYLYLLAGFPDVKICAAKVRPPHVKGPPSWVLPLAGFALLWLIFVGQPGFYSLHASFEFDDINLLLLVFSVPRIAAGVLLIAFNTALIKSGDNKGLILWGMAEISCVFALIGEGPLEIILFVVVFLEISLNILATYAQGTVAQEYPQLAVRFLAPTVMLGAIAGPIVFGTLIGGNVHQITIGLAVLACAIPTLINTVLRPTK
ncbi:hypothetical protein MUY35_10905 [Aliiroseovarius sp. S1339]|uniref:hypothetical protein n=1 Tax=Aliiroseovarius sp. S1339 TaxID=2936990 RepID=UPI0020C16A4A|nr:hypothetical protein [Aliiroseovarius sp. S1339]MCK8464361.1 hypothetical protein [Aliiroseovarius sp. S1339]